MAERREAKEGLRKEVAGLQRGVESLNRIFSQFTVDTTVRLYYNQPQGGSRVRFFRARKPQDNNNHKP